MIETELAISPDRVNEDTSLFHDCGAVGEDGDIFMQAFAARFDVNLMGFPAVKFLGVEAGFNPITYLLDVLSGILPSSRVPRLPISHLLRVAEMGVWTEPGA